MDPNSKENLMNRLYLSDTEKIYAFEKLTEKRFSERELEVNELENGIVLPVVLPHGGGVSDENFNFIAGHLFFPKEENLTPPHPALSIKESYTVEKNKIRFVNETVVFGGVMMDHPGHLIYECISNRMWWHLYNPDSKLKFVFVTIWGNSLVKEFLELLNVPEDRILFIDEPTQFSRIIIPEQSIYRYSPSKGFTKEYMLVLNKIKENVEPAAYEKIYLTRRKVKKQDTVNEEYFIDFFEKKGFKIIDPEDHTIREKIAFFRGAGEVACLGGTNALYTLFSDHSTKLFLLGRANDPVAEQYVPYEAANIKDCYVIDVCLNFLHKNRVWGVNLIGATNYWKRFVKDHYNEEIFENAKNTIKEHAYDYLERCAEYYSDPSRLNNFKAFSHFDIINLMNQVFLGRTLDDKKYDLKTAEVNLRNSLNAHIRVLEFFGNLADDGLEKQKFARNIYDLKDKKIAILCRNIRSGIFFEKFIEKENVNVVLSTDKGHLADLSAAEWEKCLQADVIINCNVHNPNAGSRDGKTAVPIKDLFIKEPVSSTPEERFKSEISELNDQNGKLTQKISELNDQNVKLTQKISELDDQNGKLTQKISELSDEKIKINDQLISTIKANTEYNTKMLTLNEQLTANLSEISVNLTSANNRIKALESERDSMRQIVSEMENSRSWRLTKPLRSIMRFFRRLFGKKEK